MLYWYTMLKYLLLYQNEILWISMLFITFLLVIVIYRYFGVLGLYCWTVFACMTANIQVLKVVQIFGLSTTLGNILYASTFLASDILCENHGKKVSQQAVIFGLLSIILITLFMNLAIIFEPASNDFSHSALVQLFRLFPRVAIASVVAYVISQFHDIWAFMFWKRLLPQTRFLWLRNNMSTLISQLIDSIIFTTITFWAVFPLNEFTGILISTFVFKAIVALTDTPWLYLAKYIGRKEHQSVLDIVKK